MIGCPADPPRNCPEAMQAAASFLIRWLPIMKENPTAERKAQMAREATGLSSDALDWVKHDLINRGGAGGGGSALN